MIPFGTPTPAILRAEDKDALKAVLDGLTAFNDAATGAPQNGGPLSVILRDGEDGPVLGGALGHLYGGWLHVHLFHIPEPLRRQGWGRRLLTMLEDEARKLGAVGSHLDTFSFQARGFYERLGYRLHGMLEGNPPGHARYYLSKRFGPVAEGPRGPDA